MDRSAVIVLGWPTQVPQLREASDVNPQLLLRVVLVALTISLGLPAVADAGSPVPEARALIRGTTSLSAYGPLAGSPEAMTFGISASYERAGGVGGISFLLERSDGESWQVSSLKPRSSYRAEFTCGKRLRRCRLADAGQMSERVSLDATFEATGRRRTTVRRCDSGRIVSRTVIQRGRLTTTLRLDTSTAEFGVVQDSASDDEEVGATMPPVMSAEVSRYFSDPRGCDSNEPATVLCDQVQYVASSTSATMLVTWEPNVPQTSFVAIRNDRDGPFNVAHAVAGRLDRRLVRDTSPAGEPLSEARFPLDDLPFVSGSATYRASEVREAERVGECRFRSSVGILEGALTFDLVGYPDIVLTDVRLVIESRRSIE